MLLDPLEDWVGRIIVSTSTDRVPVAELHIDNEAIGVKQVRLASGQTGNSAKTIQPSREQTLRRIVFFVLCKKFRCPTNLYDQHSARLSTETCGNLQRSYLRGETMTLRHFCIDAAGAIALVALRPAALAAPLTTAGGELRIGFAATSNVEKAAYHGCRRSRGVRVCRWVGTNTRYFAYSGSYAATLRAAASSVPMP